VEIITYGEKKPENFNFRWKSNNGMKCKETSYALDDKRTKDAD
jgi:hypothetical protein